MNKAPLGLPEGSVRALLAIAVVVTVCAMVLIGRPISEQFMGLALAVFACYFTGRNNTPPSSGAVAAPLAPILTVVPVSTLTMPGSEPDPTLPATLPDPAPAAAPA